MENFKEIREKISLILESKKEEIKVKWQEVSSQNEQIFEARKTKDEKLQELYLKKYKIEEEIEGIQEDLQYIEYQVEESVEEIQDFLFDILGLNCQVKLTPLKFKEH